MRNFSWICLWILAANSRIDALTVQPVGNVKRGTTTEVIPAPIVVPPSQYFDGIDGSWSTFMVRVGTPAQSMKVIGSTNSPQTIVVRPEGCSARNNPKGIPPNCASSRGGTFQSNLSSTWLDDGWKSLNGFPYGFEANLDYNFVLDYGMDKMNLGFEDSDTPVLENQTIAGYNFPNPLYLGLFGLNTQPVIFETYGNLSGPSYFETLRNQNLIPSLSWSYTAGAFYRFSAGQYAQIIFGGYDTSRYQDNDLSIKLSEDVTRDIVVAVQSIFYSGESTQYLLPSPIYAFIESTDPNIWLPLSACKLFEQAFDLQWDNTTEKYLMNDTQFTSLTSSNPSVTFRLASGLTGGATVDISLPFKAFGLKAAYPFVPNDTYYFPLQRATNSTQYTLGRTFLQEAYLTVDYDRRNFSISQCTWVDGADSKVVPIIASTYGTNNTNSSVISTSQSTEKKPVPAGAIAGGVIGGIAFIAIIAGAAFWFWKKKQTAKEEKLPDYTVVTVPMEDLKHPDADKIFCTEEESEKGSMYKKAPGSIYSRYEPDGEMAAEGHEIHQLPGDTGAVEMGISDRTVRYELDGGSLSIPQDQSTEQTRPSADSHLRPFGHQSSVGSVSSTSGLLLSRHPSPLSRGSSVATTRTGTAIVSPISQVDSPGLSPRTDIFSSFHDRPAG